MDEKHSPTQASQLRLAPGKDLPCRRQSLVFLLVKAVMPLAQISPERGPYQRQKVEERETARLRGGAVPIPSPTGRKRIGIVKTNFPSQRLLGELNIIISTDTKLVTTPLSASRAVVLNTWAMTPLRATQPFTGVIYQRFTLRFLTAAKL